MARPVAEVAKSGDEGKRHVVSFQGGGPAARKEQNLSAGNADDHPSRSFSTTGIGQGDGSFRQRHHRQHPQDSASDPDGSDSDQGTDVRIRMTHHEADTLALRHNNEIFAADDHTRCVSGRIRWWLPARSQVARLTTLCTLCIPAVSKAKGKRSNMRPLLLSDKTNSDLLFSMYRERMAYECSDGRSTGKPERHGRSKLSSYYEMWDYISEISSDSAAQTQYLDCHLHEVRDRNEVLREQLLHEQAPMKREHARTHRACEVNEVAHWFLKNYFGKLQELRDRRLRPEVICEFAEQFAVLAQRVVRLTPDPNHEHALVVATTRLCRFFEFMVDCRFETSSLNEILTAKLSIDNTSHIRTVENRTTKLERMVEELSRGKKKPPAPAPAPAPAAPGPAGNARGGKRPRPGQDENEDRAAAAAKFRAKDHERVDRAVARAAKLAAAKGRAFTKDELLAMRQEGYDDEDKRGR